MIRKREDGCSWHTASVKQILPENRATLIRAAKRGDAAAVRSLVEGHLWLVEHVGRVRKIRYSPDVWQAGALGLYAALEKFDPDRGLAFDTYALWQVYAAMSSTRRKLRRRGLTGGRKCDPIRAYFTAAIPDCEDRGANPARAAMRAESGRQVRAALARLRPAERRALALRFGLDNGRELPLRDASRVMGITLIAYRALLSRALKRAGLCLQGELNA